MASGEDSFATGWRTTFSSPAVGDGGGEPAEDLVGEIDVPAVAGVDTEDEEEDVHVTQTIARTAAIATPGRRNLIEPAWQRPICPAR
jgi:hypothetical protein